MYDRVLINKRISLQLLYEITEYNAISPPHMNLEKKPLLFLTL